MKKPKEVAETRSSYAVSKNRALPAPDVQSRPIPKEESGAFVKRLREVIGDESVLAFSKRCGISEATLRSYINDGRAVPVVKAAAIALAGGVLVDWLATGRLPKTRSELKALQDRAGGPDPARLRLALTMTEDAAAAVTEPLTAESRADLALAFYQRLSGDRHEPK